MNYSSKKLACLTCAFCLLLTLAIAPALARPQSSPNNASTVAKPSTPTSPTASSNTTAPKTTKAAGAASDQEIAAAKASGKVWVNTESRVYHKSGRWYGKTKQGKFMTEAEAKAAGYKEAHR